MNKQQLASRIWESANRMRSKIEANEYKDYILGFIFYKYLSDQEVKFLKENDYTDKLLSTVTEDDTETLKWVQQNIGYFIAYKDLFSTWIALGNNFDVSNVRDALSAFSRLISATHKKVFSGVFDTLQTGLSKLGDSSSSQTKAISGLLQLIKDIPMDGRQDYDVLGFIYEYLISMFAANAGKKAGEFYTPHEVSLLMSEIVANHLKGKNEIEIYDPTSGSGSLLINIGRSVAKYMNDSDNIKYYAQELKVNTYNLTRMNLVMRGIKPDNIVTRNADTLEDDWPLFDENDPINTYTRLRVDAVVSNPPYSQTWDPTNKQTEPRYSEFGVAPKSKADYAFLLHDLYHLKTGGIMTIVLPHGVLFRGGEEGTIRKNLIEKNHIDTIIGLPANIFFGTGIPTIIMVLKPQRADTDVLIVDASKGFVKEGKNNKLRASDIKRIADTVSARISVDKFSRLVTQAEIRSNDYNLNIPRYVDSSEQAETWDIYASMFGGIPVAELAALERYWAAFPGLQKTLFTDTSTPYVDIATGDIKQAIKGHADVLSFESRYQAAFADFGASLSQTLIRDMDSVVINSQEAIISHDIFARLAPIPLIDPYEAYQLLDDAWAKIATDLEIIQTEGFEATKKVDPNLVIKKKNGQEQEVQDGWVGHVIPFTLVQTTLLKAEYDALKALESRLAEISSTYEELAEDLTEEEKEGAFYNENVFVPKGVTQKIKELLKDSSEDTHSLLEKLKQVDALMQEEKELKAQIRKADAALQAATKTQIETLTHEQVTTLLEKKWIVPLVDAVHQLPNQAVDVLVSKLQALQTKYAVTFADVETQIKDTSAQLSAMIDQLTGSEFDTKGLAEFKALLGGEN